MMKNLKQFTLKIVDKIVAKILGKPFTPKELNAPKTYEESISKNYLKALACETEVEKHAKV